MRVGPRFVEMSAVIMMQILNWFIHCRVDAYPPYIVSLDLSRAMTETLFVILSATLFASLPGILPHSL